MIDYGFVDMNSKVRRFLSIIAICLNKVGKVIKNFKVLEIASL